MISRAIWFKQALVNFLKDYKLHLPYGDSCDFVVLEKFTRAY